MLFNPSRVRVGTNYQPQMTALLKTLLFILLIPFLVVIAPHPIEWGSERAKNCLACRILRWLAQ